MPNIVPFVVILACAAAVVCVAIAGGPIQFDWVTPFSFFFVAVGLFYIVLSLAQMLPTGILRPFRSEFVVRHAYYVPSWLILMAGTTLLFREIIPDLARLARRSALPALIVLAIADIASAYFFGNTDRLEWEGYVPFLDPGALVLFYSACFFIYVALSGRIVIPLMITSSHFAVSNVVDYGQMFNTMTGSVALFCMWVFALAIRRSAKSALIFVSIVVGVVLIALVFGTAAPAIFGLDNNSEWRFVVWRENLFASLNSGLLGVGFGTPYYGLSAGNVAQAYRLTQYAEFQSYAYGSAIDLLYIRGQHSSFVNAFYRMGLLGGGLLIAFNACVLAQAFAFLQRSTGVPQRMAAAAAAIFLVEVIQIAVHVGLESPRYFAIYALAVGLARATSRRPEAVKPLPEREERGSYALPRRFMFPAFSRKPRLQGTARFV